MPPEFKPKHAVLMTALAAAFPLTGQAAAPAARVDFAVGDVKALTSDGRSRSLVKGAEIASGEMIDTGSGRAQVRFTDGAQISLAPQTQFRIDNYEFKGQADGSEKGFFSLLKGGLRTITGWVGRTNRDNYKVTTTVATIGIRGTEYSVSYGNSINVTTGEGTVEVCNAAGCLILNSGETAYVPDSNTRPAMSDKKPELPPPPVKDVIREFSVSENTNSSGAPTVLPSVLPSGSGYSMAMAGPIDTDGYGTYLLQYSGASTSATFDSASALTSFSGSGVTITAGATTGALSDGIIGWGRWSSGTYNSSYDMLNVHYVAGIPTTSADMSALQSASATGTYSLTGYTYPTACNNSSCSTVTIGTQAISGSLTANFGTSTVSGSLSVPIGAYTYSSNWSGAPSASGISGSDFSGTGTVTGGSCSGCSSSIKGFFAGANAARAGLVYNFSGTTYGTISGAATFGKTN